MKLLSERQLINRLHSIEAAERYLIARTHKELNKRAQKPGDNGFVHPGYKSALAVGVTCALVWMLQYGGVGGLLGVTV